jgi:4-amino-4-deoxy-L-arabinose transferase-like glycosyltransferase
LITVAAAVLRLHALTAKSFWFDEGVSVGIARLDWYNFVRILWRREANMSLYYLLLRGWLHLGHSDSLLRLFSVLFGVAAVPALYLLGRRLFDSRIALTATALLCVNSYHVRYSQEARSYALTVFLCILSSLYLLKLIEVPLRRNRVAYILLSVLAVYGHFFSGLMLLAQWLSLRFLHPQVLPKEARKTWVPIALAVSPAVAFIATTGAGPLAWIPRPGLHALWRLALYLTGNGGPLLVFLYAGACIAAIAGNVRWRSRQVPWDAWRCRFLLFWAFLPVALVLAVSIARPLLVPRYFIFSLPALALLAACGLAAIPSRWPFAAILLLFLGISLRATAAYYQERSTSHDDNWRAASQYLLGNARPGDAVVFHVAMGRLPYEHYQSLQNASFQAPTVLYPYHGPQVTFRDFVEKPNYAQLESAIPQHPRVWFVISQASTPFGLDSPAAALSALINDTDRPIEYRDFGGIQVVLYSRPDSR